MTRSIACRTMAPIAAVLVAAACSTSTGAPAAGPTVSAATAEEYAALYQERLAAARTRFTPADVDFMSKMIHHHAQAIEMSKMAPERTGNNEIRILSARIINAQTDEITLMSRWLTDRGQPVPEVGGEAGHGAMDHAAMDHAAMGHGTMDHAAHTAAVMPGMLTPEDLRKLSEARGTDFDRLFLGSMIRHHQGAVTMVEALFETDGALQDEEVFKFASDVQVDQRTEVARMERMLEAMDGPGTAR